VRCAGVWIFFFGVGVASWDEMKLMMTENNNEPDRKGGGTRMRWNSGWRLVRCCIR
jgi:hypothetical protein